MSEHTEENPPVRMCLAGAIASILGRRDHPEYREIGLHLKVQDLRKLLGLTGTPMIYSYLSYKTDKIDAERALVIYEKFNIIIDQWLTSDELKIEATNAELSKQIAKEPLKDILADVETAESKSTIEGVKRELRKIIARYY